MRNIVQLPAILFCLAHGSCSSSSPQDIVNQVMLVKGPPSWASVCELRSRDALGDKRRQYCKLEVKNDGSRYADIYALTSAYILEIDDRGTRVLPGIPDPACGPRTLRVAVDGVRIDGLAQGAQVEAVLNGSRLVRDELASWPHCRAAPYATRLDGIRDGYEKMLERWRTRERAG